MLTLLFGGETLPLSGGAAVGLDGKLYSGSRDETIRVWSGLNGTHISTLTGHICSLAVGTNGKLYSGSFDGTIRVW